MNVSYEWLRAFVPFKESPAQLRDLITSRVTIVDELLPLRSDLAPIVVARVVEAARHPESDRLSVTKVDAGTGELLDVVCGAPNVQAGKLYPFAPTGTKMPNGVAIERKRIRGITSNGMLCSPSELGLGADGSGIMELDFDAAPGTPLLRVMPVGDTRLVIDVMPNRPDLLSHLGIAREIAAALRRPLTIPGLGETVPAIRRPARVRDRGRTAGVEVSLDEEGLARRYMAVVIRGVTVGPSPEWLAQRLDAVGSRSINNIVDATNFVLHELGQPTHAFDLAKLSGSAVSVRRALAGESITTLDGIQRALDDSMTVIADASQPQAIAGVMGGRESEVAASTKDILLEVASFDPTRTRATRRALGLSTDASYRFERGVDVGLAPLALERVARLIIASAGGRVDDAPVDILPDETRPAPLALRASRVALVLGEAVPADDAAKLLRSIGFDATIEANDLVRVVPPTWRVDIAQEIDLIEEVARLRGYDTFPVELRPFRPGNVPDDPQWLTARRVRQSLVGAGLLETRPMPFVKGADDDFVRVANPIAENEAYLRRDILDTLARRAEYNLAHMQGNIRLFEIGAVFHPRTGPMPLEELHVGALVMGRRRPPHFTDPKSSEFDAAMTIDEWDAKALGDLVARASYPSSTVELQPAPGTGDDLWQITIDGTPLGRVRRLAIDAPVWAKPAFGVELSLGAVDSTDVAPRGRNAHREAEYAAPLVRPYRPLSSTPAAEFDLALLVPKGVLAADVGRVIREASGDLLESLQLVDEFAGGTFEEGFRSLAWRLTFRHPDRTLGAKEIEGRRASVLRQLEKSLNVKQRTS